MCPQIDSLAPAYSALRLPVHVARIPAAPFPRSRFSQFAVAVAVLCVRRQIRENPRLSVADYLFLSSCFESLAVASHPLQPDSLNIPELFCGRSRWAKHLCGL